MRRIIGCVLVLMLAGIARGQEVKPDDLRKLLDQTKQALKEAQDRKAELATENLKLSAQVNELAKVNQAQAAQLDDLKRRAAAFADRTLFLSAQYAAWTQFLEMNPVVKMHWSIFEETTASVGSGQSPLFMDTDWPLSSKSD
jgi:predicted nuclease with TOPRIM domain